MPTTIVLIFEDIKTTDRQNVDIHIAAFKNVDYG
jgi:hypothetical protein